MAGEPVLDDMARLAYCREALAVAQMNCASAQKNDDPVRRRRFMVRMASALRDAANWLDDEGRLSQ
jgi:hypothetical protein